MVKKGLVAAGVILIGAAAAVWFLRGTRFDYRPDADRNVLLVTIDTLRADALGIYGGRAFTPNLDRLAARGATFDFAHAHAVVTLASHASILSGTYPYEHGIRDNTGYRFPASRPTAATALKAQGFATGAFVGGFPLDHRFGLNVGFDRYDDTLAPVAGAESGERERRAEAVVAAALDWIGGQTGKWFSWVHVYDPHVTYAPPEPWAAKFPSDPYLAEVSYVDASLGALFDRLATLPRRTLVIVTADHGEGLGDHGELTHSVFAYESTIRVPLVVAELGGNQAPSPKGVTVKAPARHVDILPTILEAVRAPALTTSGASLRPLIESGAGGDRPSYFEAMSANLARGWAPLRGVIVGAEKFIDLPIAELYDLDADPRELRNAIALTPDRGNVLYNTLKSFNVAPPGRPQAETPETVEALRSLGYIGGATATAREKYTENDDPKKLIELEQMMTAAMQAFQTGRIDEAMATYGKVIERRPDMEDAYRKLALAYWRTGRPNQAVATLEAALRAGVTQAEVTIKLGEYLAQSGQTAKAIALLSSVAGTDPDALVALGNAYQLSGRTADAVKAYQRLLAADPKNGVAHMNLGIIRLEARDVAGAETALRQALALDPGLASAYTALGVVFIQKNATGDAVEAWKRAVALDGTEFNAMFNLIDVLSRAGQMDAARPYAEQFITTAPPQLSREVEAVRRLIGR